jgi:selenocysteine-specific elongation factor
MTQHFILATAGHVDHGKSSLVKALTGTDPDRLPEEKARGITIDLGFAHLELETRNPEPATLSLGIVDVPGHEDFVKNMVAGVGSIDLALFVVAADDGWMPQTEEHLQILTYLGVTHAVVALTKVDLASDEASRLAHMRERLAHSPFAEAPIIPVSVVSGRGLDELQAALARVLTGVPPPRDLGKPRLPVDRVFTLRGIGTVVTGTLSGGGLRRGQAVTLQPSGLVTRVRSLQSHNRDVESSGPGTRTAVNLADVAPEQVHRGDVITLAELGPASAALDVVLEKSARLADAPSAAVRPLKDRTRVRLHHGSGNVAATVHLPTGAEPLAPGGRALARLRLETPVFAFAGDRFIVRDWSEQATLAGGVVLDPDAAGHRFTDQRRSLLPARADAPDSVGAFVGSQLARDRAVRHAGLLVKSRFSAEEVAVAIAHLVKSGVAAEAGDWLLDAPWWQALQRRAAETIHAAHRAHPEWLGLPLNDLRQAVEGDLSAAGVFDALLAVLGRNGFAQAGTAIRAANHQPALPPALQTAGARIRAALSAKPFEPPPRKELAPDTTSQKALRFLLETGEAIELSEETVLAAEHFARATEAVRQFLRQRGQATASDLRQALHTNRRVIIPLLERLDRDGVTRRQGDVRVLR